MTYRTINMRDNAFSDYFLRDITSVYLPQRGLSSQEMRIRVALGERPAYNMFGILWVPDSKFLTGSDITEKL